MTDRARVADLRRGEGDGGGAGHDCLAVAYDLKAALRTDTGAWWGSSP